MPMTVLALDVALVMMGASAVLGEPAGELRVALPWTPENLDPTMNLSSIRAAVGVSLFDSLVRRSSSGRCAQVPSAFLVGDSLLVVDIPRRAARNARGYPRPAHRIGGLPESAPAAAAPAGPAAVRLGGPVLS